MVAAAARLHPNRARLALAQWRRSETTSSSETGPIPREEAIDLLDALKDGELEEDEAARVKEHLATCERRQSNADALLPAVQRKLRRRSRGQRADVADRGPDVT